MTSNAFARLVMEWWCQHSQNTQFCGADVESRLSHILSQVSNALECMNEAFVVAGVLLNRIAVNPTFIFDSPIDAAVSSLFVANKFLYDEPVSAELCAYAAEMQKSRLVQLEQNLVHTLRWDLFVNENDFLHTKDQLEQLWASKYFASVSSQSFAQQSQQQHQQPQQGKIQQLDACQFDDSLDMLDADGMDFSFDLGLPTVCQTIPTTCQTVPMFDNQQIWGHAGSVPPPPPSQQQEQQQQQHIQNLQPQQQNQFLWLPNQPAGSNKLPASAAEWQALIDPSAVDFSSWPHAVFSFSGLE